MTDITPTPPRNRRSARHTQAGAKPGASPPARDALVFTQAAPKPESTKAKAKAKPAAKAARGKAQGRFPLRTVIVLALCCVIAFLALGLSRNSLGRLREQKAADIAEYQTLVSRHTVAYRDLIERYAAEYGLQPAFVAAVILRESSYDPGAQSRVGARGLMQVMEDTFVFVRDKLGEDTVFDDMYDPAFNIRYGCWYLAYLSRIFNGDPVEIACAYHAGPNNVKLWIMNHAADGQTLALADIPMEDTRSYAGKVLAAYAIYAQHHYHQI